MPRESLGLGIMDEGGARDYMKNEVKWRSWTRTAHPFGELSNSKVTWAEIAGRIGRSPSGGWAS